MSSAFRAASTFVATDFMRSCTPDTTCPFSQSPTCSLSKDWAAPGLSFLILSASSILSVAWVLKRASRSWAVSFPSFAWAKHDRNYDIYIKFTLNYTPPCRYFADPIIFAVRARNTRVRETSFSARSAVLTWQHSASIEDSTSSVMPLSGFRLVFKD